MLSGKDAKIDSLMQEVVSLRNSLRDRERTISTFHAAAESLIHVDHKFLDVAVKEMYSQVVLGTGKGLRKLRTKASHESSAASLSTSLSGVASGGRAVAAVPTGAKAAHGTPAGSTPAGDGVGDVRGRPRPPDAISLKEHVETVDGTFMQVPGRELGRMLIVTRLAVSPSRCFAEIIRQKEYVHQSETILKRQLDVTSKTLSRKAQMATDDNILLIQCVLCWLPASRDPAVG